MEEKNKSILDLPADYTVMEISSGLTLKEVSQLARITKGAITLFANALTNAKVVVLLQHVAFGEQEKAVRMLKKEPTLLLRAGQVTDYSGRTFQDITAFQYALWALDRHMWRMILEFLSPEEAAKQLRDHVDNKKAYKEKHGDYYDFTPLIGALQTYVTNHANWTRDERIKHWCEVVWGAQLLVPAHVANEYCRADQPFHPVPKFNTDCLPRDFTVHNFTISCKEQHWFAASSGDRAGVARAHREFTMRTYGALCGEARWDLVAVTALYEVRTDELVKLKQQLLNPAKTPEELNPDPEKSRCVIS